MKKEEWLEAFEAINGRKPSAEEFFDAQQNGEFLEYDDNEPVLEHSESSNTTESSKSYKNSRNVIFCQNCGGKNPSEKQVCLSCGKRLKTSQSQVSGNIFVKSNLFTYLKYCVVCGKWAVPSYFFIFLLIGLSINLFIGILILLFTIYLTSKGGQNLICRFVGAKRIERLDYQERITRPVARIIAKARANGLNLPEDIDIYLIQHDSPIAYAVGMNRIIVSESLLDNESFLESKIMFELNRIHNQSPNLLLVILGMNFLLVTVGLIIRFTADFQKNYGDRRASFWTGESQASQGAMNYYLISFFLLSLLGLNFLFVRLVVRRDVEMSDKYVASLGLREVHTIYLDKVSDKDTSLTKRIFELGFPNKDSRVAMLQKQVSH